MKSLSKILFYFSFILCTGETLLISKSFGAKTPTENYRKKFVDKSSSGFFKNNGQIVDINGVQQTQVLFSSYHKGLQIFITNKGLTLVMHKILMDKKQNNLPIDSALKLEIDFLNASILPENVELVDYLSNADFNFYSANNPNGILKLHAYSKIRIKNIYNKINWVLETTDTSFKQSFEVEVGGNPSAIQLQYNGSEKLMLDEQNDLTAITKLGWVKECQLHCFQEEKKVDAKFLINKNTISYVLKNYDPAKVLVIDPTLVWSTLFYTSDYYQGMIYSVATDAANNF